MDDVQLTGYCPVNEAKLFSSPLITCKEFRKQCNESLGNAIYYRRILTDEPTKIQCSPPVKEGFTPALSGIRLRRTKDSIPKDDSAQSRPNIPWNKNKKITEILSDEQYKTIYGKDIEIYKRERNIGISENNEEIIKKPKKKGRKKKGEKRIFKEPVKSSTREDLPKRMHERNQKLLESVESNAGEYGESTTSTFLTDPNKKDFAKLLKTDLLTIEELDDVCKIDNLKSNMEEKFDVKKFQAYKELPSDEIPLETLRLLKQNLLTQESINYPIFFADKANEKQNEEKEKVKEDEVILDLSISFFEKRHFQGYYLLSCQTLADLCDAFVCSEDKCIPGELSENPNLERRQRTKDMFRSSFFFIEGCFYNDTRHESCHDLSKVIRDWAKEPDKYGVPGLGLFKTAEMHKQKIEDLKIRLGYPYLFQHQGNCEHLLIFHDMRLVSKDDPQFVESYPYMYHEIYRKRTNCSVCQIYLAKWMTINDTFSFEDPSFFCDKCFQYLHYDEDGKKLCSFEAYACPDGVLD